MLYRVELHESILKTNDTNKSKYLMSICIPLLRYLKQDSELKRTISQRTVKQHSRFIMYSEIKAYLKLIGYNNLNSKFFNSLLEDFKKSSFVQSSNTIGVTLKTKLEVFKEDHHIYSTLILKPGTKYNNFVFSSFIKFSTEFLYGIPQSSKVDKQNVSSVQPIAQKTVAKALDISQPRIQQIHQNNRKVYVFAEISKHQKDQEAYFGNSYVREINNLGVNEDGSYKEPKYFKLIGSKLMSTLNFKSFIRGYSKTQKKVIQRKLPRLSNAQKGEYKNVRLMAPKQHSRIDKVGLLHGFKTNNMRTNDVTPSSFEELKTKTFQIVAYNKESSLRKLDVLVRLSTLHKDIEDFKYKYKIQQHLFYNEHKQIPNRINFLAMMIAKMYYSGYDTSYLNRNFINLKKRTHKEISKFITYKQNHSKFVATDLTDEGETVYSIRDGYIEPVEVIQDTNYLVKTKSNEAPF